VHGEDVGKPGEVVPEVPRGTGPDLDLIFGPQRQLAERFASLLVSSGVDRGLLGPREAPRIWDRHLVNCARLADLIDGAHRVVDVGSGAGLPGIVLAIVRPDVHVTLLEPLLRRVTWLDDVIPHLGLDNVTVVRGRAPDALRDTELFDVATARAVAGLDVLLGWTAPLVRRGGRVLAIKGDSAEEELAQLGRTVRAAGWADGKVLRLTTGGGTPTTVVEFVITGEAGGGRPAKKPRGRKPPGQTGVPERESSPERRASSSKARRQQPQN
jgi:16S rRNA (guanine527-N7)-methyltransferase